MSEHTRANAMIGTLVLSPTADSGREHPVWSGFHCRLRFPSGVADAMIVVEGRESVSPGGASEAKIYLAHPELVEPQWLVPDTVFEVLDDGERPLGRFRVFEPVNDVRPKALSL